MSGKIIKGSTELGRQICMRRSELGFTIGEAASKAGVGTKTWSRYEAGESIRRDKILSVCKTLNWHTLPGEDESPSSNIDLDEYKKSDTWPKYLSDTFGDPAAVSFVQLEAIFSWMISNKICSDFLPNQVEHILVN